MILSVLICMTFIAERIILRKSGELLTKTMLLRMLELRNKLHIILLSLKWLMRSLYLLNNRILEILSDTSLEGLEMNEAIHSLSD